ncbi:hypothetical protein LB505_001724 [Fusarium chuoi]|nr:hypothetical protein LB505_001724 [Fusarium chuoi]
MCLPHVDVSASNLDPSSLEGCTATLSLDPSPRNPHLYNIDPVTFLPQNIMKVTIKKWNTVATWRWDIPEDDVCGICQVHFDGTCPTCKYPGDDCSLYEPQCRGSAVTTFTCTAYWNGSNKIHREGNAPCVVNVQPPTLSLSTKSG